MPCLSISANAASVTAFWFGFCGFNKFGISLPLNSAGFCLEISFHTLAVSLSRES
jgi:hypothetical protein